MRVQDWQPAVEETHISVLFLVGDRVYKLKKPVHFPFLDWRERSAREEACRQEVDLNRRLAPDVYLGVADVVQDGELTDHLVVMRRMPVDRRLGRLVRSEPGASDAGIDALAAMLADFHGSAGRSPDVERWTTAEAVRANWDDNLNALASHAELLDEWLLERVGALADRYLAGRGDLFRERARRGLHVDGHGDLLADDVYLLEDGPRVLDCLEFSPRLRAVDVLDDVASLAMDLERLGATALAEQLVEAYVRHSGETHPASLLHHYIAYRASVRAKVACLRTEQGAAHGTDARDLLSLAHRHLEAGQVRLVLVGGLPGTGKSTVAAALAARTGWHVMRSDVVRKELAGDEPAAPKGDEFGHGLYSSANATATYKAMLDAAEACLSSGTSVLLDATWSEPRWRAAAARVASSTSSELTELHCVAPMEVAAERIRRRSPEDPSDATPAIAATLAARAIPWPEAVVLDTTRPLDATIATALDAWQALSVRSSPGSAT